MFDLILTLIAAASSLVVTVVMIREAYPAESYAFVRIEDAPRFSAFE